MRTSKLSIQIAAALLGMGFVLSEGAVQVASAATFVPPKGIGAPGRREGAGTRGSCVRESDIAKSRLTAIIPESRLGLTVSERPSFFLYLPKTGANVVRFELKDAQHKVLYRETIEISGDYSSSLVRVQIPETETPLEVGKDYYWKFSLVCNPHDATANVFVEAAVRRIVPSEHLQRELATTTSAVDRAAIYARSGIWFESVASLAVPLEQAPSDRMLQATWNQLLESVGLGNLADAPLPRSVLAGSIRS